MIRINFLGWNIHLVIPQPIPISCIALIWLWQILRTPDNKYDVSILLDTLQKSLEIETTNDLGSWWEHVCRIEIIPDSVDFPNGKPMVFWVAYKGFFIIVISYGLFHLWWLAIGNLNLGKLHEGLTDNLDAEVTIICYIMTDMSMPEVAGGSPRSCRTTPKESLLVLVQLHCDLTHRHLIEIRALKKSINAVNTTHHVSSLFFKVNSLRVHFSSIKNG